MIFFPYSVPTVNQFFVLFFIILREMWEKLDFVISLSTTTANNQSSFNVGFTLVKHVTDHGPDTCRPLRILFFMIA